MRQIERDMLSAIRLGKCWHKANTEVYTCGVYQHKFEWFITDDKLVHQFENGYTFARV